MSSTAGGGRLRLEFLDGIRGLSALYVLLFHSLTIEVPQAGDALSWPMRVLRSVFGYGHFAVCVFIVLSGFSLMLPLAWANTYQLQNGFAPYLRRRARRVLPPYYAALVLSIAALVAAAVVSTDASEARDEALTAGSIMSHLLLVHNLDFEWAFRINGPMWSVATEWQIYFLFPLVLLPLWRRIGALPTIGLAWGVTLAIHVTLPFESSLDWAAPWFVGSFALGMWAAVVSFNDARTVAQRWDVIALALLAVLVVILWRIDWTSLAIMDLLVSLMATALILACVRAYLCEHATAVLGGPARGVPGAPSVLTRLFASKPAVVLGAFSYSAYLLQHPLLRLTEAALGRTSLGYEAILWVQLVIGTPVILLASRIFAEFFELPFTTGSRVIDALRSGRVASRAATPGVVAPVEPSR